MHCIFNISIKQNVLWCGNLEDWLLSILRYWETGSLCMQTAKKRTCRNACSQTRHNCLHISEFLFQKSRHKFLIIPHLQNVLLSNCNWSIHIWLIFHNNTTTKKNAWVKGFESVDLGIHQGFKVAYSRVEGYLVVVVMAMLVIMMLKAMKPMEAVVKKRQEI